MANQLTNNSLVSDMGLHSLETFVSNRKPLNYPEFTKDESLDRNNTNESNSMAKLDSPQESNDFSKRMGFLDTSSQKNQSIPHSDSEERKYSEQKVIPKPYPYSSGSTDAERNGYAFPKTGAQPSEADRLFSSRHIKPDWNRFEESIDTSLAEPKKYYPKKENTKRDEKRDNRDDNSYTTEDHFDSDYGDETTPPMPLLSDEPEPSHYPPDEPDMSEPFDFDDDDKDDKYDRYIDNDEPSTDYQYKEEETPECAFGHSFCYSDDQYPEHWMRKAVDKQMDILTQIMPESADTFELVEGIPKERDENFTYLEPTATEPDYPQMEGLFNSDGTDPTPTQANANYKDGGYACPSYVNYIRPKRAMNNDGLWKVILNLNETYRGVDYNQHIRIEECVYEKSQCSFAPNYVRSECVQKYGNERLLAWTPEKGIHLDVFRLPIACSCHMALNTQTSRFDKK